MVVAMDDRKARVARNESISREINEGLEEAHASSSPGDYLRIVCECGQEDCPRLIAITTRENIGLVIAETTKPNNFVVRVRRPWARESGT